MNRLLLSLLLRLLPGIDDDDFDPEPADPADSTDPVDPDETADPADPADPADTEDDPADPSDPEPDPAPRETRAQRAIRETRERAQKAEQDAATLRAELEAARRGPAPQAQKSPDQVLWEQEDEVLRNPETTDWQRYAVNAARAGRQAQAEARAAHARTEDLADRTAFAALASTKPKLYAAYKDRVEAKLVELRGQGRNVNREGILKVMLGEDMLAGKFKSTTSKGNTTTAAPRTATPRQDVTTTRGGGLSEAEKRAKRLENVRI